MPAPFSVLIVGAGKIGAFFDTPASEAVLTHAHGFAAHPGFRLLGFVDADPKRAEEAASVWGGEVFSSIADAFARQSIDVAVVAAPDEMHYSLLKELADQQLRLVFAEKPLTRTLAQSEDIVATYRLRGISLAVNFTRRFVGEFTSLRDEIAGGFYGRFLAGNGYYGKGTLHNGTHLIDLLRFLLGEIRDIRTLSSSADFYIDDPTCSALLTMEKGGDFVMQAVDCRWHTIFELDLLFEKQRVRITDSGATLEIHAVQDDELFAGYRKLQPVGVRQTSLRTALASAVESIYAHLDTGATLPSTGSDGLMAQQACLSIINGTI